jgi:hypothetical protein
VKNNIIISTEERDTMDLIFRMAAAKVDLWSPEITKFTRGKGVTGYN